MGADQLEFQAVRKPRFDLDIHQFKAHAELLISSLHTVSLWSFGIFMDKRKKSDFRYSKWEKNGTLSFIPPDGRFSLLEYEAPAVTQLPLSIKAGMSIEGNGGEF